MTDFDPLQMRTARTSHLPLGAFDRRGTFWRRFWFGVAMFVVGAVSGVVIGWAVLHYGLV